MRGCGSMSISGMSWSVFFFFISCLNILFIDYSPVSKMVLTIRITAMTEKEKIFRVEFSNSSLLMLRVA